jgi:Tfp pilus assembly protein PilP
MFNKNQSAAIHRVAKTVIALSAVSIVCLALPACQSKADEDVAKIREMMEKKEAETKAAVEASQNALLVMSAKQQVSRDLDHWNSMSQTEKDKAVQDRIEILKAARAAAKAKTP